MDIFLHQIRSSDGTGTLSYLLADNATKRGIVIDPNIEDIPLLEARIKEEQIKLDAVIDTHTHVDHVSAASELKRRLGAKLVMHENTRNKWKVADEGDKFGIGDILRANAANEVDQYIDDGDILRFGESSVTFLYTPGHTDNHVAVLAGENLFTGDVLLIGQAGRSDLPGGSPEQQFETFENKILPLPDKTKIWPGHDYEGNSYSFLKLEKKNNPFLRIKTREEYLEFVRDFFPPLADVVSDGKMTLQCGVQRVAPSGDERFKRIGPEDLAAMMKENPSLLILDVREQFELPAFGAIAGVVNIPASKFKSRIHELPADNDLPIVAVCQTGSRSREAAHFLCQKGFSRVFNLEGGVSAWIRSGKAVERSSITSNKASA